MRSCAALILVVLAAHAAAAPPVIDLNAGRRFWSFQPPRSHPVPAVKDAAWPRGDIDRFVLAKLEEKGIRPVADADAQTLVRRLYYDLIGLPPTPEQIDTFVSAAGAKPQAAVAALVDQLLASPHFGERWGRHWLDVARYADSTGGGRSMIFKDAWRYRDYVIDSFNADRPYDQFIREQIAGDLLPFATPDQRRRQLVATAFLALGPTNYEEQDKDVLEMDVIDEQIDTLGRAFLGMTIGCARCHDHKFDPIPTRDYYALAGILKSTHTLIHDNVSKWVEKPLPMNARQERAVKKYETTVAVLRERIRLAKGNTTAVQRKLPGDADDVKKLAGELKKLTDAGAPRPTAMAVEEAAKVGDISVCIRGNLNTRGELAPRGVLQVTLPPDAKTIIPAKESGRRQLADWLASPTNPLTARVMVNRIWHHLFGAGIVRTVDEFGVTGEAPSHPELLDHLALRFVQEGWSVKKLIREIVLSRTYQLSAAKPQAEDPENRLLGRHSRRRLDAEALRDTILVVSGKLDRTMGGPTVKPNTTNEYGYVFDDTRRSVYTPVFRNRLPELFAAFDFADPNLVTGRRTVSTTVTQALYLTNNAFVMDQARLAARAALALPGDDAARLDRAYRVTLGRLPSEREREIALAYVAGKTKPDERQEAWERLYQALFACVDFRFVN